MTSKLASGSSMSPDLGLPVDLEAVYTMLKGSCPSLYAESGPRPFSVRTCEPSFVDEEEGTPPTVILWEKLHHLHPTAMEPGL